MAMKPGPIDITIGAYTLKCDSVIETYETQPFDRVEFDHEKLKTVPLSTGTQPIVVTLLGGVPAEITIDSALQGMIGGASSYQPRPLTPNAYMSDFNNIKQRVNITRWKVTASAPETATPAATVDGVFAYVTSHKDLIAQFANRLAIMGSIVAYESLLAAQADNIQTLYFTTGITFSAPGIGPISNVMVVDGQIVDEFVVPNISGGYDIYKTYDLTLEQRTVTAASAA